MLADIASLLVVGLLAGIAAAVDLHGSFNRRKIPHVSLAKSSHAISFVLVNVGVSVALMAWTIVVPDSSINEFLGGDPGILERICAVGLGVPVLLRSRLFTVERYPIGPALLYDTFRIRTLLKVALATYHEREKLARTVGRKLIKVTLEQCNKFLESLVHLSDAERDEARKKLESIFLVEDALKRGETLVTWLAGIVGLSDTKKTAESLAGKADASRGAG